MTIRITPARIRTTPASIRGVNCSWKISTPIQIAVSGSSAPKIAVVVEPTSFIDTVIVSSEIIVGKRASHSEIARTPYLQRC